MSTAYDRLPGDLFAKFVSLLFFLILGFSDGSSRGALRTIDCVVTSDK